MVDLVLDARDMVGESLVWDERRGQVAWLDICGRRIHRLDPASGAHEVWGTGRELPTSLDLREDGAAVVGLTRRVALWDWAGEFRTLAVPEPDEPGHRLNEGRVAPDGSLWVATTQSNIDEEGGPMPIEGRRGRLYRVTAEGIVQTLSQDRFGIPNTMAWLPDGRFVTADTTEDALLAYDPDDEGRPASRRPFGASPGRGLPDGSCLDAEGGSGPRGSRAAPA